MHVDIIISMGNSVYTYSKETLLMISQHRRDDILGSRCIARRFTQSVFGNFADVLYPESLDI
jgi:hypothetical protein